MIWNKYWQRWNKFNLLLECLGMFNDQLISGSWRLSNTVVSNHVNSEWKWFETTVFSIYNSIITSFKRFESKPVVKIIYIYTHCNLWRHRQFITIFYEFLHIRIEIIHGSHMYILFVPRVGLYVTKFYPER